MAGRIRSIKPEWLEDERMVMASSDARVLSIALILMADDYGNGRCCKAALACRVFPPSGDSPESLMNSYDRFSKALSEVTETRFAGVYEIDGQQYFTIRKWKEHQKVQHPGKPLVPYPPEGFWRTSGESHESLTPDLRPTTNDLDQRPTINRESEKPHERLVRQKPDDPTRRAMEPQPPEVSEMFSAWREESGKTGAVLDRARSQLFARLVAEGVTVDQVREATRGAKLDAWARDSAKLSPNAILGSADQREKFIGLARDPPRAKGSSEPRRVQPNSDHGPMPKEWTG